MRGLARTRARRSSARLHEPDKSCARLMPGTLSVRSGAHAGHARTTTALAAVLRRAVSIRRTRHRHADRRCPHRRQSCPQTCRLAYHPAAKNGARLLLLAGIASAKRVLGRRRRHVPSAPNAALAQIRQTRSHHHRLRGHGRPSRIAPLPRPPPPAPLTSELTSHTSKPPTTAVRLGF